MSTVLLKALSFVLIILLGYGIKKLVFKDRPVTVFWHSFC